MLYETSFGLGSLIKKYSSNCPIIKILLVSLYFFFTFYVQNYKKAIVNKVDPLKKGLLPHECESDKKTTTYNFIRILYWRENYHSIKWKCKFPLFPIKVGFLMARADSQINYFTVIRLSFLVSILNSVQHSHEH